MTEEAKTAINDADEIWSDGSDNTTERERALFAQVRELIGLARGLVVAVEAAVASRPVVTINQGAK